MKNPIFNFKRFDQVDFFIDNLLLKIQFKKNPKRYILHYFKSF